MKSISVRKLTAGILAVALVFGSAVLPETENVVSELNISASAVTNELRSGDFGYKILSDNTVEITAYYGESPSNDSEEWADSNGLDIPEEIDGKPVTSIGLCAFKDKLKYSEEYNDGSGISICMPETVTSIGDYAFYGCDAITYFGFPYETDHIGKGAFYGCSHLSPSLSSLENLTEISDYAFFGCYNFIGEDDCSLYLPYKLKKIGKCAFKNCLGLKEVNMYDSVEEIGEEAFFYCGIRKIEIPASVKTIGSRALGYDNESGEVLPYINFKIICDEGSAAEQYALENGMRTSPIWHVLLEGLKYNEALQKLNADNLYYEKKQYGFDSYRYLDMYVYCIYYDSDGDWQKSEYVYENNGFLYSYDNGNVVICGYVGNSNSVTIPEKINGVKVSTIDQIWCCQAYGYNSDGVNTMGSGGPVQEFYTPENGGKISVTIPDDIKINDLGVKNGKVTYICKSDSKAASYFKNKNTEKHNYKFSDVTAKNISSCKVELPSSTQYFRGTRIRPVVTVKDGSTLLKNGKDYSVTYANNLSVGTATITITGNGNYTGSVTKTFSIVQRSIGNCQIELSDDSFYFNGKRFKPSVNVYCNGTEMYSGNYTVTYSNNISAGTATVTLTGKKNLKGTVTKTFKINPRNIGNCTIKLSKNSSDKNKPNVSVNIGSTEIYKGNYTVSYSAVKNGKVTVTIKGKNNLAGTAVRTYTVV